MTTPGNRRPGGRRGPSGSDSAPPAPQSNQYRGATSGSTVKTRSGATVLDAVVPAVYGDNAGLCDGLMAARRKYGNWYHFAWIFAYGEQDSIDEVWIGNRQVWPVYTANGYNPLVYEAGVWVGDGTDPSANLTLGLQTWMSAAERQALGDFAGFSCRISKDKSSPDLQGQLVCKALLGGKIVALSGGGTGQSDSLGDVALDVATADEWKGIGAARLDTGAGSSWENFTNYCDELMGDGSKRYHFRGTVLDRNPDSVMADVVSHGLGNLYYNAEGKLCIWHEGPPAASSGTWSATASTTINGSGGAALSEVSAGDWIIVGTSKAKVVSVTDDNTIVLDRQVTVSSASLRVLGNVEIKQSDWISPPSCADTPLGQIPDVVIVRYEGDDGEQQQHPKAADVTGDKRVEVRLSGCRTRKMAKRVSETMKNIASMQPFTWKGEVGPVAAPLEPGDIVPFSTDILSEQLGKVIRIKWNVKAGTYAIELREFDPAAFEEGTSTEDTPPTVDIGDPDAPTALTMTFGETGPWDDESFISNPDNITGWTWASGLTASYDAVDDETELTYDKTYTSWLTGKLDITSYVDGKNVLFVSQMMRWISGIDEDVKVRIQYFSGADAGSAVAIGKVLITPYDNNSNSLWERTHCHFSLTNDAYHEIRLGIKNDSGGALPTNPKLGIKRVRSVAWGTYGENDETIYSHIPDHVTAKLKMYVRWDWTEHSNAWATVDQYQLRRGDIDAYIDSTGEATDSLTWAETGANLQYVLNDKIGTGGTSVKYAGPYMLAVGQTGKTEEFPVPTQAFEGDAAPPALDYDRTYYEPITYQTEEPYTYEYFNWFDPDNDNDLDPGVWNDYEIQLWVDLAGGTNYVKVITVDWPNRVGFGYGPSYQGEAWFYSTTRADYETATYQIWLKHKYTGLSTQMSIDQNIDGNPSPPYLTMGPPTGSIRDYYDGFFQVVPGNQYFPNSAETVEHKWRTGLPFYNISTYRFFDLPHQADTTPALIKNGIVYASSGGLLVDSEGASGADDLIGIIPVRMNSYWLQRVPIDHLWDPSHGTGLGYMGTFWYEEIGGYDDDSEYRVYKGNTLTTDGDEPTYTSGVRSLTFDGTNDMMRIEDCNPGLSGSIGAFLAFFIRPQTGTKRFLVSQDTDNNLLSIDTDGSLLYELDSTSTHDSGLDVSDNTWHFITVQWTWEPWYTMVVWLDGVKGTPVTGISSYTSSTKDLYFGCDKNRANTFEGDLRFLMYGWGAADHYLANKDGDMRLQAWWHMTSGGMSTPVPSEAANLLPALADCYTYGSSATRELPSGTAVNIRCRSADRPITVKSNEALGNIQLHDDADCVLDDPEHYITLRYEEDSAGTAAGKWYEVGRSRPISTWLTLTCNTTTTYRKLMTLPASKYYTWKFSIVAGNYATKDSTDEILVSNEANGTINKVWTRLSDTGSDVKGSLDFRALGDNTVEVWAMAENNYGTISVQCQQIPTHDQDEETTFVLAWAGAATTTAPTAGTSVLNTNTADPDFFVDSVAGKVYHAGNEIISKVADQLDTLTEKTTLADNDMFLIEDSAASNVKKYVKASNVGGGGAVTLIDLYQVSNQTLTTGANDVAWDAEREKDSDFIHSTSTNNYEIEIDFDGRVDVTASCWMYKTTTGYFDIAIYLNTGAGYALVPGTDQRNGNTSTNYYCSNSTHAILDVSDGDKIKIVVTPSATASLYGGVCKIIRLDQATLGTTPAVGVPATKDVVYYDSSQYCAASTWTTVTNLNITSISNDGGVFYWLYNDYASDTAATRYYFRFTVDGTLLPQSNTYLRGGGTSSLGVGPTAITQFVIPIYFTTSFLCEFQYPTAGTKYYRAAYQLYDYS